MLKWLTDSAAIKYSNETNISEPPHNSLNFGSDDVNRR